MALSGRIASVTIKNERNSDDIRRLSNAKLEVTRDKSNPKVVITLPGDDEVVCEFRLKDCEYMEGSSNPGEVECIRIKSKNKTLIIIDREKKCKDALKYIREYLRKPPSDDEPEPEPEPVDNGKVNELIRALKNSDGDSAGRIARQLAEKKTPIQFALDMINETGNAKPTPPPQPVVQPLKLKLSIESFLINETPNQRYDIAILPNTTVNNLKQMVEHDAHIPPNQQFWYINREHLDDNYAFGSDHAHPRVNENTILTLFIAKPQN